MGYQTKGCIMTTLNLKDQHQKATGKKMLTELVFIVDRSGSMSGLEGDTIGGINAALARNREVDGDANVSIVLFDDTTEVLIDRVPLEKVHDLTERDYWVRGCTALLDCLGDSIRHTDRVQRYMPDEYKADHVIFVITTDGLENASSRHTYQEVRQAVEKHREQGWEFIFLGANMDAVGEAGRIGISADRAATYYADSDGIDAAYSGVADFCCEARACAPSAAPVGSGWKKRIERSIKSRRR